MGAMVDRAHLFNVRMSEAELAMVRELSEHLGLSQSDAIRQLVRKAHAEVFGPARPAKKQKR
jgi:hypothetical protein